MAAFPADRRLLLAALVLCAPLLQAATPPRPPASLGQDIVLDASSSQIDYGANRLTFSDVSIAQGALRIQADKAVASGTGLRFDDSRWEFSGNVRIRFETGTLSASQASVRFAGNRIAQALAQGTPAEFEQKLPSMARPVRGHAGHIDFNILEQTIRLSQDAWLFDGRNEISSQALLYSIRDQLARNETEPGSTGRVHITIRSDATGETPLPPGGKP